MGSAHLSTRSSQSTWFGGKGYQQGDSQQLLPQHSLNTVSQESITCLKCPSTVLRVFGSNHPCCPQGSHRLAGKTDKGKRKGQEVEYVMGYTSSWRGWEAPRMGRVCTCWDVGKALAAGGRV